MSATPTSAFSSSTTSPLAREALRTIAQNVGAFAVEFASNHQDAIYRIRNNAPDIILCDYVLGEGRSGQQLLEELRRFNLLSDDTIFMMVTGEQAYEQVVSAVELVPRRLHHQTLFARQVAPAARPHRGQEEVLRRLLPGKTQAGLRRRPRPPCCRPRQRGRPPLPLRNPAPGGRGFLAAGDATAAEAAYRNILDNYGFPWARAGVARALHHQNKLTEARAEIDRVVASTPIISDASDLKGQYLHGPGRQRGSPAGARRGGQEDAAQLPAQAPARPGRHLNGDTATATAMMADVVANDTMPGAVSPTTS